MAGTTEYLNFLFCKKGKFDFIVSSVSIRADEMAKWLVENKAKADANNGWLNFDILQSPKDENKHYAKTFTKTEDKKQVTAKEHMPDREAVNDDLPF